MNTIHSCIEASIEDLSNASIDLVEACGHPFIQLYSVYQPPAVDVTSVADGTCNINYTGNSADIRIETTGSAIITMDWVCNTNQSINYLEVTPTGEVWISIGYDADYDVYSNTTWRVN